MAIVLHTILSVSDGTVTALVEHGGRRFTALVAGEPDRLRSSIGATLIVELDYERVCSSRILPTDTPDEHGLYPLPSGAIRVVGSAHNIIPIADSAPLVDIYMQTGPEFMTFEADELTAMPAIGDGIEVVVGELCFYPTWP